MVAKYSRDSVYSTNIGFANTTTTKIEGNYKITNQTLLRPKQLQNETKSQTKLYETNPNRMLQNKTKAYKA